jgi:two-component system response regulator MtrA
VNNDGARILVVEDEADVRELIVYRLSRSGFTVIASADGDEALRLANAEQFDLAVLDVMMPGLDGYSVARMLRDRPGCMNLPVIFVTARVREEDISQGYDAGADDYIRKPFNPDELLSRVRAVLARR